ncbi:MAG: PDZ domain-containing protein [Zoogloeaceae bacterium]|nr:PDZ domain-containing protein [Zoogloeaceae bacterium]
MSCITYTLCPRFPEAHRFLVTCRVERPDPAGQRFSLPAWIPGSYRIRDFARYIVRIEASCETANGPRKTTLTKIDKSTWQAAPGRGPLILHYQVYAWDLSVRAAHLDTTHAFLNGSSVFLRVCGQEGAPCRVHLQPPPGDAYRDWQVATSLPRAEPGTEPWSFGLYQANNYEDLLEHPVEMGRFARVDFAVEGIAHHLVLTGAGRFSAERLQQDLARICAWQMRLFGPPALTEPFYFLVTATGSGYGGLEHRNSTALLCKRTDLCPGPADGSSADSDFKSPSAGPEGYLRFLGLASHEYFHRWNVRRIRPAALMGQDLQRESHTRLLWFFEGFTSYYDDLCLARSGLISEAEYLKCLEKTITQVARTPGRHVQSLADSSFDAWSKYYQPDENTPNAVVSYYAKGALLALALDLSLRMIGDGRVTLDTLMQRLWQQHGATGIGLGETELYEHIAALGEAAPENLRRFVRLRRQTQAWAEGTDDLPLAALLARFGVKLAWEAGRHPWLGLRFGEGEETRIAHVLSETPAEQAGLAAGDLLVALDGQRLTKANLESLLDTLAPGEPVACHYFRHDLLHHTTLIPMPPPAETARLMPKSGNTKARRAWLG